MGLGELEDEEVDIMEPWNRERNHRKFIKNQNGDDHESDLKIQIRPPENLINNSTVVLILGYVHLFNIFILFLSFMNIFIDFFLFCIV